LPSRMRPELRCEYAEDSVGRVMETVNIDHSCGTLGCLEEKRTEV